MDDLTELLHAQSGSVTASVLANLRCLALRHLPEGVAVTESALAAAGLPMLPPPGQFAGSDPWLVWQSPSGSLLIATGDEKPDAFDAVLVALRPGGHALAVAIDLTAGSIAFELNGLRAEQDELLSHLIDASAIPRRPGKGTRVRLVDLAVTVLRLSDRRTMLLTDRSLGRTLAQTLAALG